MRILKKLWAGTVVVALLMAAVLVAVPFALVAAYRWVELATVYRGDKTAMAKANWSNRF